MSPSCCGKLDLGMRPCSCRATSGEVRVVTQRRGKKQTDLKDIEAENWPW